MVVVAEQVGLLGPKHRPILKRQLCVKREMNSDLDIGWDPHVEQGDTIELSER
jgi:hypothetical protein